MKRHLVTAGMTLTVIVAGTAAIYLVKWAVSVFGAHDTVRYFLLALSVGFLYYLCWMFAGGILDGVED